MVAMVPVVREFVLSWPRAHAVDILRARDERPGCAVYRYALPAGCSGCAVALPVSRGAVPRSQFGG